MKCHRANSSRTGWLVAAVLALLCAASAQEAGAQTVYPTTPRGGRNTGEDAQTRSQRVFLERNLALEARRRAALENKRTAEEEQKFQQMRGEIMLNQVRKDYRAIQELNNKLNRAFMSGAPDYRGIARDAVEMGRCASRLKQNLALPAPPAGGSPQPQTFAANLALAPMLRVLDTRVLSFVNNPFFQNPNVIDMDHTGKARRDLEDIIVLSRDIRRNAAQMQKVASASAPR